MSDSQTTLLLHEQVRVRLKEDLAGGRLPPGTRLPSERVLCDQLGVSRVTLRRALADLVAEGAVEARPGRGWYAASGPLAPSSFVSFTAMGAERGLVASAQVLRAEVRAATIDEAEAIGIAPGADVFDLERVRLLDGELVAVDHSCVPLARCPSLVSVDFTTVGLYQALEERAGIIATRCAYVVAAIPADARRAGLLGLEPDQPLLLNEQTVYDQTGAVIELGRIAYRFDRFRFRAELARL
jgi:GntR family transcriptional regulator